MEKKTKTKHKILIFLVETNYLLALANGQLGKRENNSLQLVLIIIDANIFFIQLRTSFDVHGG